MSLGTRISRAWAAWKGAPAAARSLPPAIPRAAPLVVVRTDPYAGLYGESAGGYAGAAVSRLTASLSAWSGSVNADLDNALPILRARGRQLAANSEHGKRFLSLIATNLVGRAGPTLQVRALKDQRNPDAPASLDTAANAAVEAAWARWSRRADITGRQTLAALLRTVVRAVAREGEALVKVVRDRRLPGGIALQLLDIDRLDEALNHRILDNGNTLRQGVEIDATGRPVAYWVRTAHPGDNYAQQAPGWDRIPAGDCFHLFLTDRPEQVRGVTWFHAVIRRGWTIHQFEEAAVTAAQIGASKIATLERTEEAADAIAGMADAQVGQQLQFKAEAGEVLELPPGYSLNSWNPEYPHANFDSFLKACLRGLAAGLDVAAHNLTGDMTDVNFSSARIAELAEREMWMVLQDWLIESLLLPLYADWLALALLRGDITFPVSGKALPADKLQKFLDAAKFQGRRWSWVDPAKEETANANAIANRTTSRQRLAAEQGEEWDDILAELADEEARLKDAGLLPEPVKPPVASVAPTS